MCRLLSYHVLDILDYLILDISLVTSWLDMVSTFYINDTLI
jgi:hypothetical protein